MNNKPKNGLFVAVVFSGPAGMAAASALNDAGVSVKVFDELKEFGGMLAYGLPEFRLPLKKIRDSIDAAKKMGIIFEQKKITSVKKLLKEFGGGFDFVVLALGAGLGLKTGAAGEDNDKVIDALVFLLNDKFEGKAMLKKGEEVAVVGGGNSAIDAARVAVKQGAKVTIIYRRTEKEMPAFGDELAKAKNEGVEFEFLRSPLNYSDSEGGKRIMVSCAEMILAGEDESGRARPIETGREISLVFDKVLLAIGQKPDFKWLESEGILVENKIIMINSHYATTLKSVYACGDSITGAKTIAEATRTGLGAAREIIEAMRKGKEKDAK
ncbi:Sulfide dehydrogenase subunit alpha [uncultured archaeon]|nr:Sulfide dehydrogenase subunit alpha [uncultured archaeon]